MRKLIRLIAVLALIGAPAVACAWGGVHGLPLNQTINNLTLLNSITHSKACQAGWTRNTVGYCDADTYAITVPTTGSCQNVAAPTGAKAVILDLRATSTSQGAAGQRVAQLWVYSGAGCTGTAQAGVVESFFYELAGTPAANSVDADHSQVIVPVSGGSWSYNSTVGTGGAVRYSYVGYLDE